MNEHMSWQLRFDQLYAEANELAYEGMRRLREQNLTGAVIFMERWSVVQDELQQHMDSRKGNTPNTDLDQEETNNN